MVHFGMRGRLISSHIKGSTTQFHRSHGHAGSNVMRLARGRCSGRTSMPVRGDAAVGPGRAKGIVQGHGSRRAGK